MFSICVLFTCATAECRYVAAICGGSQQLVYQLVVFEVDQDPPEVVCAVTLHAGQLQPEPWQLGNCMQLQLIRYSHRRPLQSDCCAAVVASAAEYVCDVSAEQMATTG